MYEEDKFFKTLTKEELWKRYCGFLDLSPEEFMKIQEHLLMDQIELVADSTLGKKIMGGKPASMEEFRRVVPLTNYEDYEPYLSERKDEALAIKPFFWCHSAGRGGFFKWLPHTEKSVDKAIRNTIASFILAATDTKGMVNICPGFRFLSVLAPIPYSSGYLFRTFRERLSFKMIPNPESVENLPFQERFKKGFEVALKDGTDVIGALSSVLVKMGEALGGESSSMKFSASYLHPKVLSRVIGGLIRAKREKRGILPKDLWPTKAIMASGMDTSIYKDAIRRYWGVEPYEVYGITETYLLAIQSWRRNGLIFLPDTAFLEFIPYNHDQENQDYSRTVLLPELEEGKSYELVVTNFTGMPLLRYRVRDLLLVTSLSDEEAGIRLPRITVQRRIDEIINLGNLAQLDEKTIWQAIVKTGIEYNDWMACKENDGNHSYIRLYLELKNSNRNIVEITKMIDDSLKSVDTDYKDVESYLGYSPLKITLLSKGTFTKYTEERIKEGADLAHLKPLHLNASEKVIGRMMELSNKGNE